MSKYDLEFIESKYMKEESKYFRLVKQARANRKERYAKRNTRKALRGY
jgi:hypothetical protein